MFSSAIQDHLVQARVEELHRSAHRPGGVLLPTLQRMLNRVFAGGLASSDEFAAIHGVQFVGHPTTTRSRQS